MPALDTPYVHYEVKDNILIATYKKGNRINLDIAKKIVEDRLKFTGNRSMAVLVYNHGVISMDKEARDYLTSAAGSEGLKAGAIILDSEFTSMLGNFILSVSKPVIPAKLFTNVTQAMKWLQKYIY
jgi:hypothetical protein